MVAGDVEVVRDDGGVLGVLRIAVAGHEDAQGVVRERALGERRDDGGVDAAGEAEDGAGAAGRRDLGGDPVGEMFGESFHRRFRKRKSTVRENGAGGARRPPRRGVPVSGRGCPRRRRQSLEKYLRTSQSVTCSRYSYHSLSLLVTKRSKTWSPSVRRTSSLSCVSLIAS